MGLNWDINNSSEVILKDEVYYSKSKCVTKIENSDSNSDSDPNDLPLNDLLDVNNSGDKYKYEFTYRSVYGEDRQFNLD